MIKSTSHPAWLKISNRKLERVSPIPISLRYLKRWMALRIDPLNNAQDTNWLNAGGVCWHEGQARPASQGRPQIRQVGMVDRIAVP